MKFLECIKDMKKEQKIILAISVIAIIAVMAIAIAVIVNNNKKPGETKEVVSNTTENADAVKGDSFDSLQGELVEDEEVKKQIEETFSKYLALERYSNSSIGPMPGILAELGLVDKDELFKFVDDLQIYDREVYIQSQISYEVFQTEMLKYMTKACFNKYFSDYKDLNGYVGFCNCAGGVPLFLVEECREIKLVNGVYLCKMVVKDTEVYDHFLEDGESETLTYQDCFVGLIVDFKEVDGKKVVDELRAYEGELEIEEIAVELQSSEETPVEQLEKEKVTPEQVKTGKATYYIKVNYGANTVTVYGKDSEGNYTVPVKAMICSCGISTPKSGVYKTSNGYKWGTLIGGVYGQYSTRIVGNILFHSVPYTAKSPDALEYWEFDKLGTKASAGCVRLMVKDAKWIFYNCEAGTMVEFYTSDDPGPLGKPSAPKISDNERCREWDPTDDAEGNPWLSEMPEELIEKTEEPVEEPEFPEGYVPSDEGNENPDWRTGDKD